MKLSTVRPSTQSGGGRGLGQRSNPPSVDQLAFKAEQARLASRTVVFDYDGFQKGAFQ